MSPATCGTFQELCGDIFKAIEANGVDFPGAKPREIEVWEWLVDRENRANLGRRTGMCRFLDSIDANVKTLQQWSVDQFERVVLALESDMLAGGKFVNVVLNSKHASEDTAVDIASIARGRVTVDARVLRACAQNAIAIPVVFCSEPEHRADLAVLVNMARPLRTRQAAMNRLMRSMEGQEEYATDVCTGGFFLGRRAQVALHERLPHDVLLPHECDGCRLQRYCVDGG